MGQKIRWAAKRLGLPQGISRRTWIRKAGHRLYVGGEWDEIGELQFDFMVGRGLQPHHVFLDIACGSLRGGVHFIRYLDPGNYQGIDRERALIRRGLSKELTRECAKEKQPEFVVSNAFEFERFSKPSDFSLAQSLFTHLIAAEVERCLAKLRPCVAPGHQFHATFLEGDSQQNPDAWHPIQRFHYSRDELAAFGERSSWEANYIGAWGHPRGQLMMQFVAK